MEKNTMKWNTLNNILSSYKKEFRDKHSELWDGNNICNASKMAILNELVEELKKDIKQMEKAMEHEKN